ncbi:C-type mannose receptor 2-like [Paramisgurnus dabryanus]|uniref:C-type mannose receptor 2-like n=1 Tax=Paramisgurnus dabryanus TaxID=90735 RepID=UPI003CCF2AA5
MSGSVSAELFVFTDGWINYQSSLYFISSEKKSWTESRRYCRERGADLIIINNKEEQDFIKKISGTARYWIGLTDIEVEGRWKWVDGMKLTTGFWVTPQPNGKRNENCVVSTSSGWFDYQCSNSMKWICKKNKKRDQLLTNNTNLKKERDQLLTNNTNLKKERDWLLTNTTNLKKEREWLLTNNTNLIKQNAKLSHENIDLWKCFNEKDGWKYNRFSYYYISSEPKNWNESRRYCRERGADLIIINNKEEQDFVKKISITARFWIGLTDIEVEGRWKWVDGSTLTTGFWVTPQPDGKRNENCVLSTSSGWFDYQCSDSMKWICEKNKI